MKIKKSVALVSILSLLTLAGCGESAGNSSSSNSSSSSQNTSSASNINSSTASNSSTSSSSSSQETKPELPDFSKLTAEELYVYALNEYLNGNYYSYQTGNTNCKSKLIKISQKVVSYKIKDNNTMFFETYTVTNNMLIKVNIAQQRLENNVDDIHAYRSSSSGVSVSTDDSGNHDGSANFGDGLTKQTAEEYTNTFGHSMFGIVSYDVTAENYSQSIVSSSKNEAADGEYSYNYVVSLSDSDTTINASKGYAVEMHQISGYAPTFKSANFTVTVNADGSIKSISVNEQYTIKIALSTYTCTSVFTTYFTRLNTISDAPEAKLNNYYSALENYNSAE